MVEFFKFMFVWVLALCLPLLLIVLMQGFIDDQECWIRVVAAYGAWASIIGFCTGLDMGIRK